MSSNNSFKETFLTKKGEDVVIGEDSTDLMVVNSNAEFTGSLTVNGESVSGGGGGGSGIVNNRIDGDLTIGEDDSEILTIASKINIPGGATGQVLTKGTDGLVEFDSLDNWVLGKGVPNLTYIWDDSTFSTTSSLVSMDLHDASQANSVATSSNKIYIYWNPLTSFKITHFYVWAGYNSSNVVYNFITNCTLQGKNTDGIYNLL